MIYFVGGWQLIEMRDNYCTKKKQRKIIIIFSIFLVEALEQEYYTRNHLGYRPEAPPPNFSDVKSRINNKHDKKFAKKGKRHQVQAGKYSLLDNAPK